MNANPILTAAACSAVILSLFAAGCARDQDGDARAAIESVTAQWQQSYADGDAAAVAALYTADAQLLPPGSGIVSGRDDIEAFWQSFIDDNDATASLETLEVFSQGSQATQIGRYTMADADGNTVEQGKYAVLWRQDQGQWRMARDIWNSDGAPSDAPTIVSSGNALIDDALSAVMPSLAATATVVDWDGNLLKEGTGGYTCLPTSPQLGGDTAPMCMDRPWMTWADAWNNRTEFSIDRVGISYMLAGDAGASNIDPFADAPTEDNEWIVDGPHLMIIVPDPSTLEGISTDPQNGGPYVMWKSTPYAHIMVPVAE